MKTGLCVQYLKKLDSFTGHEYLICTEKEGMKERFLKAAGITNADEATNTYNRYKRKEDLSTYLMSKVPKWFRLFLFCCTNRTFVEAAILRILNNYIEENRGKSIEMLAKRRGNIINLHNRKNK